ncbi:MAG TPA: phosphatase PAP2 family protein [Oleiagrimonas sp.]|nr:phosphatase PAP2 family protein [Oleiagrimonas sp.]
MSPPTSTCWQHQLRHRLRTRWLLKTVCISASISAFMCLYFALLDHPQFAVTMMPRLALDHRVPFVPWAVIPYVSLWLYIGLAPALLQLNGEMRRYVSSAVILGAIGCAVFLFFPTAVPPVPIDWSRWPMVAFLKSADASGNACPSLHVAYSVLTASWMTWLLRHVKAPLWLHAVNILWCLLIVWSTLATRQHVVLDVAAGAALGGAVAWAHLARGRLKAPHLARMAD